MTVKMNLMQDAQPTQLETPRKRTVKSALEQSS